jgi:DNA-binding transcriptional ArsR family regulator
VLNIIDMAATRKPQATVDAYEAVFTALAHPVRRRILLTLSFEGGSMTAGEIADMFEHAWPTTTRHLQVLESAGLLRHDRQGRSRIYHIERRRLELARDWLAWFSQDPTGSERGGKRWRQGKKARRR